MKLLVAGLDSAPPELLFSRFIDDLPNIKKLLSESIYGPMKSSIPAITIPAWMCMATGKTPGELGLYGFRHRKKNDYKDIWIAHSLTVKEKTVWDYLGENGYRSIAIGIPPSYPPRKINGIMVGCFITPDSSVNYTYPQNVKNEIERVVGDYIFDVLFRKDERDEVKEKIWEMTEKRFELIRHFIQTQEWDLFWFVEIGLDRIHHAFWKYFDENHHLHEPNSRYKNVIPDYYRLLDRELGKTLKMLDEDTAVMIVSDHGIKAMKGCFAVNQWMIDEGLLKAEYGNGVRKFEQLNVKWDETIAWSWGGYYARVFLNVKGREKRGVVRLSEYEKIRDEIAERIKSIRGPNGEKWRTEVYYPEELYPVAKGDKPDIMVYFDNLSWRSAGTVGWESYYLPENDTGPDDAVHSQYGVFSLKMPGIEVGKIAECEIYDVAPTILKIFGIKADLAGKSLV